MTTNGHQTSLASLYHMGGTVREVATTWLHHYVDETMVGTPDCGKRGTMSGPRLR